MFSLYTTGFILSILLSIFLLLFYVYRLYTLYILSFMGKLCNFHLIFYSFGIFCLFYSTEFCWHFIDYIDKSWTCRLMCQRCAGNHKSLALSCTIGYNKQHRSLYLCALSHRIRVFLYFCLCISLFLLFFLFLLFLLFLLFFLFLPMNSLYSYFFYTVSLT